MLDSKRRTAKRLPDSSRDRLKVRSRDAPVPWAVDDRGGHGEDATAVPASIRDRATDALVTAGVAHAKLVC